MKQATFYNRCAPTGSEVATRATASGTAASVDLSGANELGDLVKSGELFLLECDQPMYFSMTAAAVTISETAETGATRCALLPANTFFPLHFRTPTQSANGDVAKYVFNYKGTATGRWRIFRASDCVGL